MRDNEQQDGEEKYSDRWSPRPRRLLFALFTFRLFLEIEIEILPNRQERTFTTYFMNRNSKII
jgi:hypothetical protein